MHGAYSHGRNLSMVAKIWLLKCSWNLLEVERGFIIGRCSIRPKLLLIFKTKAACDYTTTLLFGVTMAETLIAIYVVLLIISTVLAVCGFISKNS